MGFSVINQLKEIHLNYDEKTLTVPQSPENRGQGNFGLDGLTPIINVGYRNSSFVFTFVFTFDTGIRRNWRKRNSGMARGHTFNFTILMTSLE